MNAEDYLLPATVEQHTPIGCKLVFERWVAADGEAFWKVSLVYQSTEQLRTMAPMSLENPPEKYAIRFEGIETGEDGMIAESDLFELFDEAIDAYDRLVEEYTAEEENAA
jgi:hypothetical protein